MLTHQLDCGQTFVELRSFLKCIEKRCEAMSGEQFQCALASCCAKKRGQVMESFLGPLAIYEGYQVRKQVMTGVQVVW